MVALQQSLIGMYVDLSRATAYAAGRRGEHVAAYLLEQTGRYDVAITDKYHNGDLLAIDHESGEMIVVEVKTARRGNDGKWRFTLWKKGSQNHRHSDVVLLMAVLKSGRCVPFVIPVHDVRDRTFIAITSHPENYGGRWSQYRQHTHALTLEVQS